MTPFIRERLLRLLAFGASCLLGLALTTAGTRLLGVWSLESGLVLALVLAPLAALGGVELAHRCKELHTTGLSLLARGGAFAFYTWLPAASLLGFWTFASRHCDPWRGLAFLVLGPLLGIGFAVVIGLLSGLFVRRVAIAAAIALAVIGALVMLGVYRFWGSPALYVYSQIVGYFPGAFYDRGTTIPVAYLWYRAGTLCWLFSLGCLVIALFPTAASGIVLPRGTHFSALGLFLLSLAAALHIYARGESLGHRTSREHLRAELGGAMREGSCDVFYPEELPTTVARRLARDCAFRASQIANRLGVTISSPVQAYFYRNAAEKKRLIGAESTFVAKPWRREIHLQLRPWPHPVLGHEIAHVIAGELVPGPFHVAASLGGLWPEPALIEGTAVALAWDLRGDLTPHQWSRVLLKLGLLPRIGDLFGLSFLAQPSHQAYTATGSFLHYVGERFGQGSLRTLYKEGDFRRATGRPLEKVERDWYAFLESIPVPAKAFERAKVRFSDRGLLHEVCPHVVSRLLENLDRSVHSGSLKTTLTTCRKLLSADDTNMEARVNRVRALALLGELAEAEKALADLKKKAPEAHYARALHGYADGLWSQNKQKEAAAIYQTLLSQPASEDTLRAIEVKAIATHSTDAVSDRLFAYLVGKRGTGATPRYAMYTLRALRAHSLGGLPEYLEARQLLIEDRYGAALNLLKHARTSGLPTERLEHESSRLEGMTQVAIFALDAASARWTSIRDAADKGSGEQAEAIDWLDRVRFLKKSIPKSMQKPDVSPTESDADAAADEEAPAEAQDTAKKDKAASKGRKTKKKRSKRKKRR